MNKSLLIGGVLALVLTACASIDSKRIYTDANPRTMGVSSFVSPPNPTAPNVWIINGGIVVDQEPIVLPQGAPGDPVRIYFALYTEYGRYEWPVQGNPPVPVGIAFASIDYACSLLALDPSVLGCKYVRPAAGTILKYTIKVKDNNGGQLKPSDPSIWN